MKLSYWMLGVITFFVLFGSLFLALPLVMGILGFLIGTIAIILNFSPIAGEYIISIGTFFWRHFFITLFFIIATTIIFLAVTDKIHKSSRFRKLKIKK